MRKITSEAIDAFTNNCNFIKDNTSVFNYKLAINGRTDLFLHGNKIASKKDNGDIFITTAGWNTVTTRERLNGIPGVKVTTKKGQLYLNGKKWDGEWITI